MIKVFHNNRCTKSREALKYLEDKGLEYEVIYYMDDPLNYDELSAILEMMDVDAIELVRTNEAEWKENFADKELDDDELIFAMIEFPKLMQRPIVVNGEKAVVARPTEKIDEVL